MKYKRRSKQIKIQSKLIIYASAIRVKSKYFDVTKTVGHILREISRHVYFFIKKEEGWITVKVFSVRYRPSPVLSEGLKISLILKFNSSNGTSCAKCISFHKAIVVVTGRAHCFFHNCIHIYLYLCLSIYLNIYIYIYI